MDPRPLGHRGLHHIRDITYGEDAPQIRTGNGPQVMATLRNLGTAIHKLAGARNIAAACRHHCRDATRTLTTIGLLQHDESGPAPGRLARDRLSVPGGSVGHSGDDQPEEAPMEVRNIRWVGVPARNFDAMVAFLRQVLGLRVNFQDPTTVEFSTSEGDEIQVMAPGDTYYDFFTQNATGPVPLFEVDDVHRARRELEEAGVEVIGATSRDSRWEWIHFRAPDGNLYELASRLKDTA